MKDNQTKRNPAEDKDTFLERLIKCAVKKKIHTGEIKERVDKYYKHYKRLEEIGETHHVAPDCSETMQMELAMLHEIDPIDFMLIVQDYYDNQGIPVPAPLVKNEAFMNTLLSADCTSNRIVFQLDAANPHTHQGITMSAEPGYIRPSGEFNSYSIVMLKGVKLRGAVEYKFYRGFSMPSQFDTLLISAYDAAGMPVFFGDLTDAYPFIGGQHKI